MTFPSKRVILPMAAVAVIAAALVGVTAVSAASSTNPQESLVQKIADTFHLDKSKVQAVFDEHRTQMQAQRNTKYADRLTQAVKDGQLTEDQKTKILAEQKTLQAKMDALRDQTPEQRRTAMQQIRTEVQTWAKDNNIDAKWLMGPGMGHGHGHGMGPGMMGGPRNHDGDGDDAPAASPSASPSPSAS
jgi:hypothetical protein